MDPARPQVDFSQPEWFWPSWKFGLPLDSCFSSLHDNFNTFRIPIQETRAFHADVVETSSIATSLEEFHALLRQRQKQRQDELERSWDSISGRLAANPPLLESTRDEAVAAERWDALMHFCREFSLDAIFRYFALFSYPTTLLPALPPQASPISKRTPSQIRRNYAPASDVSDPPPISKPSPDPIPALPPQPCPISEQAPSRVSRKSIPASSISDQHPTSKPSPDLPQSVPRLRRSQRIRTSTNALLSQRWQQPQPPSRTTKAGLKRTRAQVIAISPAGHVDHMTLQTDTPSPSQSTVSGPSRAPTETQSRLLPSISTTTTNKSRVSSTGDTTAVPQTRKRSIMSATASLADHDEDEMQPSKKIRLDDMVEPRAALPLTLTDRPMLSRARRVRKGQPSVPQSGKSTISPATVAPSASTGLRPGADEASVSDRSERCDSVSTARQTRLGNSGQHMGSTLVDPDTKDEGDNRGASRTETRQGSCRPRPRKSGMRPRQPPLSSPPTKPSSKIQKPASRPVPKAKRTTAQGSRNKGAVHRTCSSPRLARQTGQGRQLLHELDSYGKARLVVA